MASAEEIAAVRRDERLEVLRLAHADIVTERDRLRGARASFTGRLGPLPASAAIVIGLAGSTAGKVGVGWLVAAALVLALLIYVGTFYLSLPPYRVLRGKRVGRELAFHPEEIDPAVWLTAKIELEGKLCGSLPASPEGFELWRGVTTLQEAVNVERCALIVTQVLFAEIVLGLVLGIALRGTAEGVQWIVGGPIAGATLIALVVCRVRYGLLARGRPPNRCVPAAPAPAA